MIDVILQAFASIVFDPVTLGLMLVGTLAGILAGAIPGFTTAMGVILTLPFTFGMTAIQGLATMLGVFVGGFSGGLMSCMLTGIPGTPSSVATTFDGFKVGWPTRLPLGARCNSTATSASSARCNGERACSTAASAEGSRNKAGGW